MRKEHIIKYPELIAEMAKRGDMLKDVAPELGISYATLSRKLSGKGEFTLKEIKLLCKRYEKNFYELFK